MSNDVSDKEKASFALEAWKTTVGVQQHFNTIQMQIRNLAVTVLTATIAAGGIVHNQGQQAIARVIESGKPAPAVNTIHVLFIHLSTADMVVLGGVLAWAAFYFMDRWMYHNLLKAAVDKAMSIESFVRTTPYGDVMGLATAISKGSPIRFKRFGWKIHSSRKLDLFYAVVAAVPLLIVLFVF